MIRAIETSYRGYRFRSRLEARWAVFFDSLGLRWEYEKEGYELEEGRYLPDFWLPDLTLWAEVKPEDSDDGESKLKSLVESVPSWGVLLRGAPDVEKEYKVIAHDSCDSGGGIGNWGASWARCMTCNTWTLPIGDERHEIVDCEWRNLRRCRCFGDAEPRFDRDVTPLAVAVAESRGARFEFGESRGVL